MHRQTNRERQTDRERDRLAVKGQIDKDEKSCASIILGNY